MALIIDPDNLNQGTEVVFDALNKTIELVVAGNLSTDGVTLQALYSFTKEEWKNDNNLIRYEFPFIAITPEQFEFVNGWKPANAATVNLIRNAGFAVKAVDGSSQEEYAGIITLGSIGSGDQVYYQQTIGGAPSNIILTGPVNQAVKIFGDTDNGNFDYRDVFKMFVREQAKTYADADLNDIGVSTMTYQTYRFPLANQDDLKVTEADNVVDAYGVTVSYYSADQLRTIGGSDYNFDIIIDGNNKTAEEIYMAVQSALRKNTDIDALASSVIGKTAESLLNFVGDTLVTTTGVYIDNFLPIDTNRIEFFDTSATKRVFPFIAAGNISFNANLVNDGQAIYKMYYTDGFGSNLADLVEDSDGNPIEGTITGSSISFSYDYDGDTGGGSAGTDKNVTVVAIGLNSAQYVAASGTISRSTENSISLVSALERNYSNT
jgi:hypothetical protein